MTPGRVTPGAAVGGAAGRPGRRARLLPYVGGILELSTEASLRVLFPLNRGTASAFPPSVAHPAGRALSERRRELQETRTLPGMRPRRAAGVARLCMASPCPRSGRPGCAWLLRAHGAAGQSQPSGVPALRWGGSFRNNKGGTKTGSLAPSHGADCRALVTAVLRPWPIIPSSPQ